MSKAVLLSWRGELCACGLRVLPAWQRKRDEFADANSGNRFRQDAGSGVFVADKCRDVVGGRRQAAQAETGRALSWLACSDWHVFLRKAWSVLSCRHPSCPPLARRDIVAWREPERDEDSDPPCRQRFFCLGRGFGAC